MLNKNEVLTAPAHIRDILDIFEPLFKLKIILYVLNIFENFN